MYTVTVAVTHDWLLSISARSRITWPREEICYITLNLKIHCHVYKHHHLSLSWTKCIQSTLSSCFLLKYSLIISGSLFVWVFCPLLCIEYCLRRAQYVPHLCYVPWFNNHNKWWRIQTVQLGWIESDLCSMIAGRAESPAIRYGFFIDNREKILHSPAHQNRLWDCPHLLFNWYRGSFHRDQAARALKWITHHLGVKF